MKRTPRSTSLRAIRQLVPKTALAGLSMPYIFLVASDSFERSTASGCGRLHLVRQFEGANPRIQFGVVGFIRRP